MEILLQYKYKSLNVISQNEMEINNSSVDHFSFFLN